jgi:hypothetical protein
MKEFAGTLVACVLITIVVIALCIIPGCWIGAGGWGPVNTVDATVNRLYVDAAGESGSSYMVGTDKGVFEVDNGFLLGLWNADELYAQLQPGKTYRFTTKGNKRTNFFFQYYPYIVRASPIE